MRLFIAIPVPQTIRDLLGQALPGMHLSTRPHLTLRFIGKAPDAGAFLEALGAIDHKPLTLAITGVGFFKKGLLAANVDLSPELLLLRRKIDSALAVTGLVPEERAFRPHITLSRKTRRQLLPPLRMQWRAEFFCLYRSYLEAPGARHVELGRFGLREM